MANFRYALLMGAAVACVSASASAAEVYDQPTNLNGGYYSQDNGTSTAIAYDNFTLVSSADIATVDFVGNYATAASINSFTISFYDNASGVPGGLINSYDISGDGNETFLAVDNVQSHNAYSYSISLPTTFDASANTEYWISIVANFTSTGYDWAWETATGGDGISYQTFSDDPNSDGTNAVDLAFSLDTADVTAVPEPITLSLFGAGLIGMGLLRRRALQRRA